MEDVTHIFISYNRVDGEADAGRLDDTLRGRLGEERVFTDVSNIELGANWERVVDHTLSNSIAVLLVVGPAWELTEPIRHEVEGALKSGVPIIPILVRGSNWMTVTANLPSELQPLQKFNAMTLNHGKWHVDIEPLVELLERMLKDPTRARVICKPPEPISLLNTRIEFENLRSQLFHVADLAECLDDASVLVEAQEEATSRYPSLLNIWLEARYRLMLEQIGRDALEKVSAEKVARYLQDPKLESEISCAWKYFEEEKRECSRTRGDSGDPNGALREAKQLGATAYDRLRKQLPGITKHKPTRDGLDELVVNQVREILKQDHIEDYWEYIVLKNFSSYPNMMRDLTVAIYFKYGDEDKARDMLKRFETSRQASME